VAPQTLFDESLTVLLWLSKAKDLVEREKEGGMKNPNDCAWENERILQTANSNTQS